jgi:hypothetical protein
MSHQRLVQPSGFVRTVQKFFVSAFVVFTFVGYALHERFARPGGPYPVADPAATQELFDDVSAYFV